MASNINFLDFEKQLDLFEDRGMVVSNREKALVKLETIGYYKIKEFSYPLALSEDPLSFDNVNFNDIVTRYYQDKNLRIYLLHAIEKIEVSIKTRLSYVIGKKYGAFGYLNFSNWYQIDKSIDMKQAISNRKRDESKFKDDLKAKVSRSSSIDINKECNLENGFPSIWLAVDVLTFGDIVFMLKNMTNKNLREIADFYDCSNSELKSWMSCLNFVRNMCAHNSNVIDIRFKTTPVLKDEWKKHLYVYPNRKEYTNRVATAIYIVLHFVNKINPVYRFDTITTSLSSIVKNNDAMAQTLGFKNAEQFKKSLPMKKQRKKSYQHKKKLKR
ncbi:Abi family protein [Vagococcus fluvialis]|uniref:Abi family protein n=1 Tax=Vagococcus fluvialis TaxID=2738 RepID=UPI003B22771E